jgi:hypothetical protein
MVRAIGLGQDAHLLLAYAEMAMGALSATVIGGIARRALYKLAT